MLDVYLIKTVFRHCGVNKYTSQCIFRPIKWTNKSDKILNGKQNEHEQEKWNEKGRKKWGHTQNVSK